MKNNFYNFLDMGVSSRPFISSVLASDRTDIDRLDQSDHQISVAWPCLTLFFTAQHCTQFFMLQQHFLVLYCNALSCHLDVIHQMYLQCNSRPELGRGEGQGGALATTKFFS